MKLSTGLKLALLALGVLLLYSSATLRAQKTTTITVCPAGPPDCHFQKIQDAINAAIEGSTIQVKSGTYTENLTIIYKRLTLQSEGRDQVIIQGTVAILFTKSVTISGFTVKGGRSVRQEIVTRGRCGAG
jgi:pectin methylesterase-like acyl-CoA thioesterase